MARAPFELDFEFKGKRYKDAHLGLAAYAKHLEKSMDKVPHVLKRELNAYLNTVAEAMEYRHGNPWPIGTTPTSMSSRSGKTLRGIRSSIEVVGQKINDIEGRIGGPFYLRIHEYSGTIRAKRAKYLTIPLPAALDSRGVPLKRKARDWDNTFVQKSRKGNLLIFQKRGKEIIPLYALKKEVKIPARLHMGDTLKSHMPWFVDNAFEAMLRELQK